MTAQQLFEGIEMQLELLSSINLFVYTGRIILYIESSVKKNFQVVFFSVHYHFLLYYMIIIKCIKIGLYWILNIQGAVLPTDIF